jgi:hypothetical protein
VKPAGWTLREWRRYGLARVDDIMATLVLDPELGLSPRDVWEMPTSLVMQSLALAEWRGRMRARSGA